MQQGAIAQLNQLWQYLVAHCQAVGGRGGQGCIADRQRGGKYDFFAMNVDPIANDSAVVPDPVAPSPLSTFTSSLASGMGSKLLLPGLLILGALALSDE